MATTKRRTRTGTVSAATEAHRNAAVDIQWPEVEVSKFADAARQERAEQVFQNVLRCRSVSDWRPADITSCARLARVSIELDILDQLLETQGPTSLSGRRGDVVVPNPLINAAQVLQARAIALEKRIGIHGSHVDKRELARSARAETQARGVINRVRNNDYDDLLA